MEMWVSVRSKANQSESKTESELLELVIYTVGAFRVYLRLTKPFGFSSVCVSVKEFLFGCFSELEMFLPE